MTHIAIRQSKKLINIFFIVVSPSLHQILNERFLGACGSSLGSAGFGAGGSGLSCANFTQPFGSPSSRTHSATP
jgi:hypothetical protein